LNERTLWLIFEPEVSEPGALDNAKARPKPRLVKKVRAIVSSDEEKNLDRLGMCALTLVGHLFGG